MGIDTVKDALGVLGSNPKSERAFADFYPTPRIAITSLLDVERFCSPLLEPCCGKGDISEVLKEYEHDVISRDLHDWGYGETGLDFLKEPVVDVGGVITNPPFSTSLEFTLKALECTQKQQGKVAMLNRIQWLESTKRKSLFENYPLSKVWIFSKRLPRMHKFDFSGTPSTSMIGFAWFVFDWQYNGEPRIGWL